MKTGDIIAFEAREPEPRKINRGEWFQDHTGGVSLWGSEHPTGSLYYPLRPIPAAEIEAKLRTLAAVEKWRPMLMALAEQRETVTDEQAATMAKEILES